jgi:GTPase SAR1 family protein
VVFVFDITKTKTLEGLNDWYKLFTENQEAPGIVVANKIDLLNARYLLF